jgi:DNA-binding LytR/AlgR family response regulator
MDIALCDDDKHFLTAMEAQLETLGMVDSLASFCDLAPFMRSVEGGKRYDAVLMDIRWDSGDAGLAVTAEVYHHSPETKIIYITGYVDRYAQEIFLHPANLSGYLTKPVDNKLLRANLQKVADAKREGGILVLKQRNAIIPVPFNEINFIESRNHVVLVHTDHDVITVYQRLESILECLNGDFYQCHKSYVVNMGKIRRFQTGSVVLKNNADIPVSRTRYARARELYIRYLSQK